MREPPTKRAGSGFGAAGPAKLAKPPLDLRHHGPVLDRARGRNHHVRGAIVAREIGASRARSNERTVVGVPRIERPIG